MKNSFGNGTAMIEQKLVEEVHLYCSQLELEKFVQRFQRSFRQELHKIANLSTISVEVEADDYALAGETADRHDLKDCQNYVLKQKFSCVVRKIDGKPCEEDLGN